MKHNSEKPASAGNIRNRYGYCKAGGPSIDGGETRLDNLVTLCRHHHRAVHEGGFGVRMGVDGRPEFTDRRGRPIPEATETRFRGNAFALMTQNRRTGIDVSAETCVPDWDGEVIDDDWVVEALFQMDAGAVRSRRK